MVRVFGVWDFNGVNICGQGCMVGGEEMGMCLTLSSLHVCPWFFPLKRCLKISEHIARLKMYYWYQKFQAYSMAFYIRTQNQI